MALSIIDPGLHRSKRVTTPPTLSTQRRRPVNGQADYEPTVRPSWVQRLMLAFL